jgi:hypothetical protein
VGQLLAKGLPVNEGQDEQIRPQAAEQDSREKQGGEDVSGGDRHRETS